MKRGPFAVLYDTISPSCLLFMLSKIYAFSFSAVSAPLSANKRATALIHGVNMLSRRTADRLSKCGKRKFADMRWQQAYFPQFLRESCSTSKIFQMRTTELAQSVWMTNLRQPGFCSA